MCYLCLYYISRQAILGASYISFNISGLLSNIGASEGFWARKGLPREGFALRTALPAVAYIEVPVMWDAQGYLIHLPRTGIHRCRICWGLTAFWSRSRWPAGTSHSTGNDMKTSVFRQPSTVFKVLKFKEQHFYTTGAPRDYQWQINNQSMAWPSVLQFSMESITVLILTWKQPVS